MGTALTGQTQSSTYDALLKITDNGPVGGTAKVVTDGLGNDSALKIGTAGVESTGTLVVSGASTLTGLVTATAGLSGPHNGTVGATTPNTGAFTTLSTTGAATLADEATFSVNNKGVRFTAASGTGGGVKQGADDYVIFRAGPTGHKWTNNADSVVLATMSNGGDLVLTATTDSSSSTTGAVKTAGGLGVAKALYVGTTLNVSGNSTLVGTLTGSDTTDSSSSTTGAFKTSGGLGVAKKLYVGGQINCTDVISAWNTAGTQLAGSLYHDGTAGRLGILNSGGSVEGFVVQLQSGANRYVSGPRFFADASDTNGASFRAPHGVAPTSPTNGDIWTTTSGMFVRINGVTKTVTLT